MKPILDVCCGSRMFWFDRKNPNVVFMDNRILDSTKLCDGRSLTVKPDLVADFRNIPFGDETFRMVVFDPPHLVSVGKDSWMGLKYGMLDRVAWRDDLKKGFDECFRVLVPGGFLIFKWNEDQIKIGEVLKLPLFPPLFGNRRKKTFWLVFMKPEEKEDEKGIKRPETGRRKAV